MQGTIIIRSLATSSIQATPTIFANFILQLKPKHTTYISSNLNTTTMTHDNIKSRSLIFKG